MTRIRSSLLHSGCPGASSTERKLSDTVLGTVHAVAETGELVTGSATGSRFGPYVYSADRVILVAGAQKVVPDLETGFKRVHEYSLPMEDAYEGAGRPRLVAGRVLIVSFEWTAGRTHLVLVEEPIGF